MAGPFIFTYGSKEQLEKAFLGQEQEEIGPTQASLEEIAAEAERQRTSAERSYDSTIDCTEATKELVADPGDDLLSPPRGTVGTSVKLIPAEIYKQNRPKPSAFGVLPKSVRTSMPADFSAAPGIVAHPFVLRRMEAMNRDWRRYAEGLIQSGQKITIVNKEEDGNVQVSVVENIKISSCYRPGPTEHNWRYRWILDDREHKKRLQKDADSNKEDFTNLRPDGKSAIDLSRSELSRRYKNRFKNTKPSTLTDKEYLFDGYLIDRYGSKQRGRAFIAFLSVHNSGLAFDISTNGIKSNKRATKFQESTTLFKWMKDNAHKYGFTPYKKEPWHWELLPPRDAYFSGIDFVQDQNYNVRVVERGNITGLLTSRYDEVQNIFEDDVKQPLEYSFMKEYRQTKQGIS